MNQPLIDLVNISKSFDGDLVLDDLCLSVKENAFVTLLGPSGCGKTTTLRIIGGFERPDKGQVIFSGNDITKLPPNKRQLNTVFQKYALFPHMNVFQNIAYGLKIRKVDKEEIRRRVTEMLALVQLEGFEKRMPSQMSGGQRQRVSIAQALITNPGFLIADEPVSALDVSIQAQVLNLMMDLQDSMGLTYMFITHDLSVVRHISTHIAVMYLGQVVEYAPSQRLFDDPKHPYTKALLSAIPIPDLAYRGKPRELIKGEITSPIDPKPGCRFATRCPYATEKCTGENLSLINVGPEHQVACVLYGD